MSETLILNIRDLSFFGESQILQEIREIFFESSTKKEFKDQKEKDEFEWKYLGFYLAHYPEYVWVAKSDRVLGYVVGMPFTKDPTLYQIQAHLQEFEEWYPRFPGHLHINAHAGSRGQGVGQKLVERLCLQLQALGILGIHILTGADSPNRAFYQKVGFHFQVERMYNGHAILFMGRSLSEK